MKQTMSTQTMIIIAAIAVLVIGTIVYYAIAQRKSSFEDSPMMAMDGEDEDIPMVPEDDSDPEAEE